MNFGGINLFHDGVSRPTAMKGGDRTALPLNLRITAVLHLSSLHKTKFKMKQFTLKTYRSSASVDMNSFYILNKGKNSGRPNPKPYVNCFTFIADNPDEMEMFYWITFAAWQTKLFHPYLKGSVKPFITIMDLRKALNEASKKCIVNPDRVSSLLKSFHAVTDDMNTIFK